MFLSRLHTPILSRVAPFALYMLFMAVVDLVVRIGLVDADTRWLYGIKVGLVALLLWYLRKQYVELQGLAALGARSWLSAIAVGMLVFIAWINLDAPWMLIGDQSEGFDPGSGPDARLLMATRVMGAALVVPLMEELFWRSFLMRWIHNQHFLNVDPRQVSVLALLVSSALFAIEHTEWFAGLVAGLAYGLLYIRSGKIWLPIIAHAVTNGILGLWIIYTGNWHYW
ncbi:CAAX prenyl protease-related protein [Methylobacillus flagellatus]|uniref:Abortive infection protein n=1 Tax=Methylobacillus flagellatus (strain ATCC 51484 / DSM 6875 / VKM B-1610 / KT) TaxID=265072 RepID=Q1GZP0_METFK|nr:CAAX prenyl protease-related protein [Methylobacillus flagellatus]ABE50297.1 Abortive infection protein [Methylobacillus flagellatus KT]